jgi:O-antigen ligase
VVALAATTLAGVALAARFSWAELAEVFAAAFAVVILGSLAAGLLAPDVGRQVTYDGAWRGLFGHKNNLGGAMAVAIPVFAAAATYNRRRLWLWAGFGLLGAALLLLSGSKTALLAAVLGVGALAATGLIRRGGLTAVATTYTALLLVTVGGVLVVMAGGSALDWLGKDATLTGRTEIWSAAMRQVEERPWLGFGYSTLWDQTSPNTPTAWMFLEARHEMSHAHNSWLEIWLAIGLVGVIAFTLLLLKTWAETLAAVYRHGAALLAAPFLLAYTVTALTESVALTYNDLRWVIFTAIAVKLARWGQDPMASESGLERRTSA